LRGKKGEGRGEAGMREGEKRRGGMGRNVLGGEGVKKRRRWWIKGGV